MRLSKRIEYLERYFLDKQDSFLYKKRLTCFQIDLYSLPKNIKKFFSLKARKEAKRFQAKAVEFDNKILKEGTKKDLTIDQYIAENGGIKSNLDNKVYTSKSAYMEHLKTNNHHIYE
jgi:hypothetical protein